MSTHTEAEWEIEADEGSDFIAICGQEGETIAIISEDIMDDEARAANARLIAAAPRMMAKLKQCLSFLRDSDPFKAEVLAVIREAEGGAK